MANTEPENKPGTGVKAVSSDEARRSKPFWATPNGILFGVAAVIAAVGGPITELITADVLGPSVEPRPAPGETARTGLDVCADFFDGTVR